MRDLNTKNLASRYHRESFRELQLPSWPVTALTRGSLFIFIFPLCLVLDIDLLDPLVQLSLNLIFSELMGRLPF